MKKGSKLIVLAAVIVAITTYLLVTGFTETSVYYLEVSEILKSPEKYNTRGMRVSGEVVDGTVIKQFKEQHLEFDIEDEDGARMHVVYNGIIPDTFKDDIAVIIEGKYDIAKKEFNAATLLTKCPSKYEAEAEDVEKK